MNSKLTLILAAALAAAAPLRAQDPPPPPPLSAAILNFKEATPDQEGTGASVAALLQAQMSAKSDATLVERSELNEILSEQELTLSDAVTAGQAARVGQLTGAEVLVSGRVFAVKDRMHLVAKVISTSSGRVFGATASYERNGKLDEAVVTLADAVAGILKDKVGDLRGSESVEARVARQLKDTMAGKSGPKFFVEVKEEILRAPAPDPAAETEIARTLEAAGWQRVKVQSEAEIIVKGEAFAEAGARRGNLWFTRARLEFNVRDSNNRELKTDRVVCGNVDLAETVGAKGALQKAGLMAVLPIAKSWSSTVK